MLTANPLPRSKHELEGLPLTFAVGASPESPLSASSLQRKTEGGFLFSPSLILTSNARWWGFCAGVSVPPPSLSLFASPTPLQRLHRPPQVGGYPSCRELFGSLVQCHLLTHPKREWRVFLSVALNAHKLVPSPQNVSGGVLFPESCIR
jgi:hypothetical protein